jgi:metallophosphoesterase (TIGR00282 family)
MNFDKDIYLEDHMFRVLFIGDIVGSIGRRAVKERLPYLKKKYNPAIIIANGENAAGGRGITGPIANELFEQGIHGITMGNHTWDHKDVFDFIDREERIVRPANFPEGTPGNGVTLIKANGKELVIVNLQGRTFLPPLDCPFKTSDQILDKIKKKQKCILVDFHAEATSEKISMGWHLDGKVSAVVGTHTHVQTHDETILPHGTAYVSDVGMVGSRDGVLGMERTAVLQKFKTQLPVRFTVAEGKWQFHAVLIDMDESTGVSSSIKLIRLYEDQVITD